MIRPPPCCGPGSESKRRAPGWWRLVVVGLGDNSGGCSFTTHCAAGLSLDAEVVPLAAGEMSCLLPFPYTPKPNEQHGARPPALALSSLRSVSSFNGLLSFSTSSTLGAAVYLILTPSIPQTIHLPFSAFVKPVHSVPALPTMRPHHSEAGGQ